MCYVCCAVRTYVHSQPIDVVVVVIILFIHTQKKLMFEMQLPGPAPLQTPGVARAPL